MATPGQIQSLIPHAESLAVRVEKKKKKKGKKDKPRQPKQADPRAVKKIVKDIAIMRMADNKEVSPATRGMQLQLQRSMIGTIMSPDATINVRLPLVNFDVQSSAGAVITTTYGVAAGNCAGFSEWQNVFAMYRIRRGALHYKPYFAGSSTNTGQIAAGIDYGATSTAAGSTSQCLQLDEGKVVPMFKSETWTFDFTRGYPDFFEVASASQYYCYWKSYSMTNSGVGVSTYYGSLSGWIDVEFQGFL